MSDHRHEAYDIYGTDGPAAERICDRARTARAAAGRLTGYAAGEAEMPEARVSLLADVAAVLPPGEADVWSEVICARLADLRPELYGSLDPTALASQLGAYGVSTRQVWGKTADGKKANRRGVSRADVLAVISSSEGARSSSTASGAGAP